MMMQILTAHRNLGMVLVVLAALGIGACSGCWSKETPEPAPGPTPQVDGATKSNGSYGKTEPVPPKPLLKDWAPPAVAMVLSGEQMGYLEPCGCALVQLGGLSRRDSLLQHLQQKLGWQTTAFDVGSLINRPTRKHSLAKLKALLQSLRDMKYAGVGLGPDDLRLGLENLLGMSEDFKDVPLLSANIVLFGDDNLGLPRRSHVVSLDGVKVGVTSVLGNTLRANLLGKPDADSNAEGTLSVKEPKAALRAALDKLQAEKPDLLVLLSQCKLDETEQLLQEFPEFDVVLSTGGPEDPDPQPRRVGKSLLVTVGKKGKHVGVVGFYPDSEKERLKYELVDLDGTRFSNSPRIEAHMKALQLDYELVRMSESVGELDTMTGAEFVGAKVCGSCHKKAYAKWQESKHAHATESLQKGRKGQEASWIPRMHDLECLSCHVTGWHPQEMLRFKTGYFNQDRSSHLLGQQCENCHGPGSKHVEFEEAVKKTLKTTDDALAWRKILHLDVKVAQDRVCNQCHDGDNSPGFKFDEYWPKVKHPWRD